MLFFAGLINLSTLLTPLLTLMLKKDLQSFILLNVHPHHKVVCRGLSSVIHISEDTYRLYLQETACATHRIKVCDTDQIKVIVTKLDPYGQLLKPFAKPGIRVL